MRYTTDGTMPTSGANGHGTLINGSSGTITVSGIGAYGRKSSGHRIQERHDRFGRAQRLVLLRLRPGSNQRRDHSGLMLLSLPEGMDPESLRTVDRTVTYTL